MTTEAKAHATHARHLTAALRKHAWKSGWPTKVSRHLRVVHNGEGYIIQYPESVSSTIHNLEFGTQESQPSPVMHRFMNRMDEHSDHLDRLMYPMLRDAEVI